MSVETGGMPVQKVGMLMHCGHVLVLPCKRGAFATNRHDHVMTFALAAYGEYGEDEFAVLERYVRPGMTVIDVGANIGTHTVAFASMVGERGMVISFEPLMCNFHLLCANVAFSGWQQVYPQRAIVGSENGQRRMLQTDQNSSINYGMANAKSLLADKGVSIAEVTIDSLTLHACDLIKADVEGSEVDVLKGATETIKKFSPVIFAECNEGDNDAANRARLLPFLHERDYKTYWVYNRLFRPDNFKHSTDARPGRDRNVLAVHASREQPDTLEVAQ